MGVSSLSMYTSSMGDLAKACKICPWRLPFFISLRGAAKEIADDTQDPRLLDYRRNVHGVEIRMKVSGIGFDTAENGPSKFSTPQTKSQAGLQLQKLQVAPSEQPSSDGTASSVSNKYSK